MPRQEEEEADLEVFLEELVVQEQVNVLYLLVLDLVLVNVLYPLVLDLVLVNVLDPLIGER
jgi:hypothetical protein